jgi:hypothetical protein
MEVVGICGVAPWKSVITYVHFVFALEWNVFPAVFCFVC